MCKTTLHQNADQLGQGQNFESTQIHNTTLAFRTKNFLDQEKLSESGTFPTKNFPDQELFEPGMSHTLYTIFYSVSVLTNKHKIIKI